MRALSALLVLLLVGCAGVPPEAIEQAAAQAVHCHDDAADTALPLEARQGGADNMRAWVQQYATLKGEPLPASLTWSRLPAELDAVPPTPAPGAPR